MTRNWNEERLVRRLVTYRSSDVSEDEEEITPQWECPPGCKPTRKRQRDAGQAVFSTEQVDAAIELMTINGLTELERADFSAFDNKKMSWAALAKKCATRLAGDVLQLRDINAVSERVDLLHHRSDVRRAQGVRTTNDTQQAIDGLYATSKGLKEVSKLSSGTLIQDVDGALGRAMVLRRRFATLASLAPDIRPRLVELERIVKKAIETVLRAPVSDGTKAVAKRALNQWTACDPEPEGERVSWDSD